MIKTKIDLQKVVMLDRHLNATGWWNVNDLTEILRQKCKEHGLKSINHSTVERNIRAFREPKYALIVEKRQVSDHTWEFKISTYVWKPKPVNEYAARK